MRDAGSKIYRTHLFYLPYNQPLALSNNNDTSQEITFVATLSNDRMHALEGKIRV